MMEFLIIALLDLRLLFNKFKFEDIQCDTPLYLFICNILYIIYSLLFYIIISFIITMKYKYNFVSLQLEFYLI
jgi:hypothetical protein